MQLNRWFWLLALPYYVVSSSQIYRGANSDLVVHELNVSGIACPKEEVCRDLSQALNDAHDRRHPIIRKEIIPAHTGINKHDDPMEMWGPK